MTQKWYKKIDALFLLSCTLSNGDIASDLG